MLTAWDQSSESIIAVPDYEDDSEVETLRDWARSGRIICPVCREKLWLRVGEKRCTHLAHRHLADCPHGQVSEGVRQTRRLLYQFFQKRLGPDKIAGPIELEPVVSGFPDGTSPDLIVRRGSKPSVAILVLDSQLKPDPRWALRSVVGRQGLILKPVFLTSTLKTKTDSVGAFLLNPTQRELAHPSRFGLREGSFGTGESLHFVDHEHARWKSLRGLWLEHEPQVFRTESVRDSSISELLWSESDAEWTHPDEPRAKKTPPPPTPSDQPVFVPFAKPRPSTRPRPKQPAPQAPAPVEPPAWMTEGLVCTGCQLRTNDWSTATPGADSCICKTCFANGVR